MGAAEDSGHGGVGRAGPDAVTGQSDGILDGRRARRERGRLAVIDASLALIQETGRPARIDEVAARSGVSASSVFRYFGSLDDLHRQAFVRFVETHDHLINVAPPEGASRDERIVGFVAARLELCTRAGRILRVARLRSLEYEAVAEAAAVLQAQGVRLIRRFFGPEVDAAPDTDRRDQLVATIATLVSPEAWDLATRVHDLDATQLGEAWVRALHAVIDATLAENAPIDAHHPHDY